MNDLPRITIVMPSLNQSRYIEESIQSILDQNYPDLELFILDGGSTDGSLEIIERYSEHLAYWHSRPDTGQTDALIQGFSRTTGELMGWLNSDDILLPGALFHIIQAYKSHPEIGIFAGNILWIDENGNIVRCRRPSSQAAFFARYGHFVIAQPGSFFTRKDYAAVGGLHGDLKFIMDVDLYLRMMNSHTRYFKVNSWVAGFRIHSLSKTGLQSANFDIEFDFAKKKYLPALKSKFMERFLYGGLQFVNGNYVRLFFDNFSAYGIHWRKWCERNHVLQNGEW